MQIDLKTFDNTAAGSLELDDSVYNIAEIKPEVVARVVQWQLDKRRAGTHKTKGISEISGTTRKPYKQKGTGNARQGSLRSPQFRKGAVIFGPVVRDHGYQLNKKERRLGLRMALSDKARSGQMLVLDSIPANVNKTSAMATALKTLQIRKALFVLADEEHQRCHPLLRNIPHVQALPPIGANVYDIIRHETLVLSRAAALQLQERLV